MTASNLRREVVQTIRDWGKQISAAPDQMNNRWYQPFVVISYCRMLYTLQTGTVGSKLVSAQWGIDTLDKRWIGLIQRALKERPNPSLKVQQQADPDDFASTLDFVEYAIQESRHYENEIG